MCITNNNVKICVKHDCEYTKKGTSNKYHCRQCYNETSRIRNAKPEQRAKIRMSGRIHAAKKRIENPIALQQAQEKYKQTDKYRDRKILQLSIASSNIYCLTCKDARVYGLNYCNNCDKILYIIEKYNFLSTCKHCNKEYGVDIKVTNYKKVFQLNKYCSVKCCTHHKQEVKVNYILNYKNTDKYKQIKRDRKRDGTHRKRVIRKGNKYQLILRHILFKRYNYVCQGCNVKCVHPNSSNYNQDNCATIDHIQPISKGGDHTYVNTQLLCRKCNWMKRDNEKYFEHKQKAKQMQLQFNLKIVNHSIGNQLTLF